MTIYTPDNEDESNLQHLRTAANTLQYTVMRLGYSKLDWKPFTILECGCKELLRNYDQSAGSLT
jgi:hypothetical protein